MSANNIALASQASRPSKKLQARFIGPYRIKKVVSKVAYQLELPPTLRIHPTFHVSLLRKYEDPESFPHRPKAPERPDAIVIDGQEEYEVESILDKRRHRRRIEYLVKWKGFPDYDATWEPLTNLANAKEKVSEFENGKNGDKVENDYIATLANDDFEEHANDDESIDVEEEEYEIVEVIEHGKHAGECRRVCRMGSPCAEYDC